ncbi:2-polyprenyl-6-methoxyphenol hydroxylase-like FAD-dependent oxidoreductase [Mumia flava]|uniref:2-polyprenyl-6-methoxyphenol hydroxylase-like FAD-dependent oxidoreductase n=1 Tax=Mumia flava TaxID=1348852 RepID=A0A0B2BAK6_9ACTN|nr:FAD-dependent monooxygenase [Mumia flava]PJJ48214.1 2-polyprenyl-6-methoxyphenol hydroxylase-like FAD-dependent oxidoreductase [Mumia flava]
MTAPRDPHPVPAQVDVLIAGGGPSGLFLAADLAGRGVRSAVLEPRVELDWLHPRAKTTNARTMTHLRRIGLADRLRDASPLPVDYSDSVAFCTSLVGHELTRFHEAFQLRSGRYDVAPECGQQVAQPVVEQVLRRAVEAQPLSTLCLGSRFVGLESEPDAVDGVVARVADAAGEERLVRARYLVGADGVSSDVRRALGLRLEGSSAAKSNLGLLFRSEALADLVRIDPAVQFWVVGRTYAGMIGQMDLDGLWWSIVQGYDAEAPAFAGVPRDAIIRDLAGVGDDVDVEVLAEDPWTARMLLAPQYRRGRCFLVGDAAHANPPWGGHGFNTCIGDAANLAWKLDAELHGWAGPGLLDSYEAERRPVARRTIDDAATNGTALADDFVQEGLGDAGERGEELRRLAGEALQVKTSEFLSLGLVLGYDYASSPCVTPSGASAPEPDPIRYVPSAAPGCLLPHAWLADGHSLYDVLGAGFTVLVDAGAEVDGAAPADRDAESEFAAAQRVADVAGIPLDLVRVRRTEGSFTQDWDAPYVLVRPDQHVAWRGDNPTSLADAVLHAAAQGGRPSPSEDPRSAVDRVHTR